MGKKLKILLLGEYSNVHWTLAEGLRELGHEVVVASDGDAWKNYRRDINLRRKSLGRWDTFKYLLLLKRTMPKLKGFDVVQLINPMFLDLRVERMLPYYEQLKRQNHSIFLGRLLPFFQKKGENCQNCCGEQYCESKNILFIFFHEIILRNATHR